MMSIVIMEFHPVRLGVFNTLNWLEIKLSSILKHARLIFLKDKKQFLSWVNAASIILIVDGGKNGG